MLLLKLKLEKKKKTLLKPLSLSKLQTPNSTTTPSPNKPTRHPSNSDLAQVRQWSIVCGKECTVHMGACLSGGSRDAP